MAKLKLTENEKVRLQQFLRHRRLNDEAISRLKAAKEEHDLKASDLQSAANLTYADITANLLKAVEHDWIELDDVVTMLDDSEYSGKQHVCLFSIPASKSAAVLAALRQPQGAIGTAPNIRDFLKLPTGSTVRILKDSKHEVVLKIVTKRSYWITNLLEEDADREVFERLRQEERSAVIVKANSTTNLLQCRVPPREKGQQETGNAVYKFLTDALLSHFVLDSKSWFRQVEPFPIADAFPSILKNKSEFELWHDTPEDKTTKSRVSRKGRPKAGCDLRKEKTWKYDAGYSRTNMRGFWKSNGNQLLYVHMNSDRARIDGKTVRSVGRLVVNELCSDGDLEDVIKQISKHL